MTAVLAIAGKEWRDGLRNRWAAAAAVLLGGLALALAFLGSAPTGHVGVPPLAVTVVSLASLTAFLIPLIALILGYDALVGDVERGTMLLLLSYPVRRWQVVAGKFLGHLLLLAMATVAGYGSAGLATAAAHGGAAGGAAFGLLIVSSIALGAAFLALAYLVSALVDERPTAAGIAVGLWLVLVLLFDIGLLGFLAATQGRGISPAMFRWILLLDPTDVFRLVNLAGFSEVRKYSGLAGLPTPARIPPWTLVLALGGWIVMPLAAAMLAFARRQL